MSHCSYQTTNDNTQDYRFSQNAEFLLKSLGINVEFAKSRYLIQKPVDDPGERRKTLAERLRDGNSRKIIVGLEFVRCKVCHHESYNIAYDGCKIPPCKALAGKEVDHGTDEGEMPVIPEVYVHRPCCFSDKHQEVDAKAYRNDECPHRCVVGYAGSCGPSHIKDAKIKTEDILY